MNKESTIINVFIIILLIATGTYVFLHYTGKKTVAEELRKMGPPITEALNIPDYGSAAEELIGTEDTGFIGKPSNMKIDDKETKAFNDLGYVSISRSRLQGDFDEIAEKYPEAESVSVREDPLNYGKYHYAYLIRETQEEMLYKVYIEESPYIYIVVSETNNGSEQLCVNNLGIALNDFSTEKKGK